MKKISILLLYQKEMNIYGDTGNLLVLLQRLKWRGIEYEVHNIGVGESLTKKADLILGGGGQDASQLVVESDLRQKADTLRKLADDNIPMLMVCGMYQLFGKSFTTSDKKLLKGISIFDCETIATKKRLIGNVVLDTQWGRMVGYENHSGKTYLGEGLEPLGDVVKGGGNNGKDGKEGARVKNVFGSYLHGPLLSKNPVFADYLLELALEHAGLDVELTKLDDSLENQANKLAAGRPY